MDSLSKEKSSHSVDSGALKPLSSIMDIMDNSAELSNAQQTLAHQHHNLSHALLLRHRHYYGRQYSRRNSANNADASTSHGKGTPLRDEKLSFKLASQCNSDSGRHTESWEKAYCKLERIRSSSLAMDAVSADVVKMVCAICQKLLGRKPYILGNTLSSSDLSVVAVLVCGHVYHADCLEQRTCHEDRQDPPCPLCVGLLSQVDA
uniref:RING-type domain-containing protein n=1 Tax=Davidia involucrata TaxID=16924 RepID=A0A5B6ZDE1_DAVIN